MCGPHHCLGRDAFASGPEILRRLLQLRQNASILEQGCTSLSPNSANRKHQITRHPWRTSPPLRTSLSFRYTQRRVVIMLAPFAFFEVVNHKTMDALLLCNALISFNTVCNFTCRHFLV